MCATKSIGLRPQPEGSEEAKWLLAAESREAVIEVTPDEGMNLEARPTTTRVANDSMGLCPRMLLGSCERGECVCIPGEDGSIVLSTSLG